MNIEAFATVYCL